MNLEPAYNRYRPLHRPVRVTQTEVVCATPSPPTPLERGVVQPHPTLVPGSPSQGMTYYLSRSVILEPFTAEKKPAYDFAIPTPEKASKQVTLADVTKNIGIGLTLATPPLGVIPLANATNQSDLGALLASYGFAQNTSDQIASAALTFARSNLGRLCCIFVAGSAITLGTVEAIKPEWQWTRKLVAAGIGGAVLVTIVVTLLFIGIWGHRPSPERGRTVTSSTGGK